METSSLKKCENCKHYRLIIDPITGESVYRCDNTYEFVFRNGSCLDWDSQYRRWYGVLSTGQTIPLFSKDEAMWNNLEDGHFISPVFSSMGEAMQWYEAYQNSKKE